MKQLIFDPTAQFIQLVASPWDPMGLVGGCGGLIGGPSMLPHTILKYEVYVQDHLPSSFPFSFLSFMHLDH